MIALVCHWIFFSQIYFNKLRGRKIRSHKKTRTYIGTGKDFIKDLSRGVSGNVWLG